MGGITSMEFIHKVPSVEAYNKLRVNSGMNSTKPSSEVKKALEGTLFAVSVYEDNELIGLGRVVGDGGITFVVSDIMVDKKFQRRGIAHKINVSCHRKHLPENLVFPFPLSIVGKVERVNLICSQ